MAGFTAIMLFGHGGSTSRDKNRSNHGVSGSVEV